MTKRVDDALRWGIEQLAGAESPDVDARVLLCHVLKKPASYVYTWPEHTLDAQQWRHYQRVIQSRATGKPVAHITGVREFWSLELESTSDTLIPRPETELLVEATLARLPEGACAVCDLGCGTGAIALAIASERPEATVVGADVVSEAVALARRNAKRNDILNTHFLKSHWFDAIEGRFSAIVSNPPYVESDSPYLSQGDVRFEPASALTSGPDGLNDIRYLIENAPPFLKPDGYLLLEHGHGQAEAIRTLMAKRGYSEIETLKDLAGHDRVTLGRRSACD